MQRAPLIVNRRLKRRASFERNPGGSAGLAFSLVISLAAIFVILFGSLVYTQLTSALPSPLSLPLLIDEPDGLLLQPTRLYDRSGGHLILTLENPAGKDHRYLHVDASSLEKAASASDSTSEPGYFSPTLVKATLALADPTFWSNSGFILKEWNNPLPATIAERLVSTLLLADEKPGILHNLRLRLLAAQVTSRYGRTKILEWYLNTAQYGPLVYGADAAARVYFHKPASDLNLSESATLAAIAEAPQLSPFDAPQITTEKRQQVIHTMLSLGLISAEDAAQASQAQLSLVQPATPDPGLAPAFTNLVLQQLSDQYGEDRLERGGLRILTSLDYDLQSQVNCALKAQLQRINQPAAATQLQPDANCPAARLLPTMPVSGQSPTATLTAEVIVYDPRRGEITAMAGDPNLSPDHPVGSLLTPFIYLTAFTRGLSPASLVWDIPSSPSGSEGLAGLTTRVDGFPAESHIGGTYHGPVRIRTALANDYLTPAAQLLNQVGPENVTLTAQQLGVASLDTASMERFVQANPPFEGGKVSLLEMAGAYGVFANQGILAGQARAARSGTPGSTSVQPITVLSVETGRGDLLASCLETPLNCSIQDIPVLSPQLAYLITDVLSDETARWPAYGHPNPLEVGRPAGAKMGRTPDGASGWTIGFTPQTLVGVWIGPRDDQSQASPADQGALTASASLWHAIIQYASRSLPPDDWPSPAGIQVIEVCDPSGMLPTPNCPTVVNEVFLTGNEPTQPDNLYKVFHVNRETGRLATVFTPPELVEDRVYLVVPPQAAEWARSTNLPIPPDDYDVIYTPPTSPNAIITAPAMFATATGKIAIQGTADGQEFSFYRLQVGKGLNPTEWVQIGKDNTSPVQNGTLGQWDADGLDGLYALQLLVVHKDQRLETSIIQLTIDSQPPQVEILHPVAGQTVKTLNNTVVLQASASDDLALSRVEFYLDNQLVGTLYQMPFTLSWQVRPGSHKYVVKAFDLANNSTQDSITFTSGN
jgi:membrane peptidoglycan carboxypeptidase